jgi:hypothetical protein
MDSTILAGIIGGIIGGAFSILAALIMLLPFIKQWKEEIKEKENQRRRDTEYALRIGNIGLENPQHYPLRNLLSLMPGEEEIKKKRWWQFWK